MASDSSGTSLITAPDKWSTLAGLRFLLASVVAFSHLGEYVPLGALSLLPKFGAFEAILGFLLISGYSVSVSYLKEPAGFFLRRFERIYPVYLASIVLTLIVSFLTERSIPTVGSLLLNLLLLNQLLTTSSLVGPAWSLSLECWLYGLGPTLLHARPAWNRLFVYLSFGSFLIYTACRTAFRLPYFSAVGYGANLLFLSFIWICGLRLARHDEDRAKVLWDIRWIFAAHIVFDASIQLAFRIKHHAVSRFFSEDALGFGLQAATLCLVYFLFTVCVLPPRPAPRRSRWLRFLGDVSYPLYLIHIPVYRLLAAGTLRSPFLYYLVAFTASAALYWSVDLYSKRRHLQLASA